MKRRLLSLIISFIYLGLTPLLAQPVFNNPCPNNIFITLSPGECDTLINYSVTANGVAPVTVVQVLGMPFGSVFPLGLHLMTFIATDGNNQATLCNFAIDVQEYQPTTTALVCDDTIHVSLPSSCEGFLSPDHVLEGDYGCYDKFQIDVDNTGTNRVDASMINKYVMYSITHTETLNSCMGLALVQDKLPPVFTNCDPVTIHSYQNNKPVTEGGDVPVPNVSDCSQLQLTYSDLVLPGTCNDPYKELIARTWKATDIFGNISSCVQSIVVLRISLASVTPVCPPTYQTECVPGQVPDLRPEITGYPTVQINAITYPVLSGSSSQCRLSSTYSDKIIPMCGGSYRILRTWKVVDCCMDAVPGVNPWTCIQLIDVTDTTVPVIEPVAEMTVSLDLNQCTARPFLAPVKITDCSDLVMEIITPVGSIYTNGGQIPPPGLPVGDHTITIRATDKCSNTAFSTFVLKVRDTQKPVAACKQFMVVSLNAQGIGIAAGTAFNMGSNDNCCLGDMKVARMTDNCGNPAATQFGDFVEFCCSDVGDTVQVILRVYDCHGNYNECMVFVEVQDQMPPTLSCPPDITILCSQDYRNQDITGRIVFNSADQRPNDGLANDNCIQQLTLETDDIGSINCGTGVYFRTFEVTDIAGFSASCIQKITIVKDPSPPITSFVFPQDTTVGNCGAGTLPDITGTPVLPFNGNCHDFTVAYKDSIANNTLGVCEVVYRRWVIVDLCVFDPNVPNSPGRWEHVQIIKVDDNTAPLIADCLPRKFCNFRDDCGFIAPNLSISATDNCTPSNQLNYTWVVDLYNDGIPDIGSIYTGTGQNTENFYDYGTHKISYQISDACGNTTSCSFLFTIEDCKKPNVFCRPIVTVQLQAGGFVNVAARDLDDGSSQDNCTPKSLLRYSFTPIVTDTLRTFTCLHKGSNTVKLWVSDLFNNQDSCNSIIIIEDTQFPCTGGLIAFTGKVSTEQNAGVSNVTMQLSGSMAGMAYTDSHGEFQFASIPAGKDYSITPGMDDHPLNGVTTYDMVLLQRHILGIQQLDSPYKIIAGDINRNNVLTTSDLVDLRRVILHILPQFPNNKSWRFIDGWFEFPDPSNPLNSNFREVYNVNNLSGNSPKPSFVAVKVGDVNGSAAGANLLSGVDARSAESDLFISTDERRFQKGESFKADFSADISGLLAYQFTLNFNNNALEVLEIIPGKKADLSNFGTSLLNEGAITASWGQVKSSPGYAYENIFSVLFRAKTNGSLGEMVSISSRFTHAEAYDSEGRARNIQLQFANGHQQSTGRFELMQNVPNPFTDKTTIGFELPEATSISLTIYDISGRKLSAFTGDYSGGYNEVTIDKAVLPAQGVLYYHLETPTHTATRKMTFLK